MTKPGQIIPRILLQIADEPDLQAWAQRARANHQKLTDVVKALIRQSIATEKAVNVTLREMDAKLDEMNAMLRSAVDGRILNTQAPSIETFVRNPTPDYETDAENLFEGAAKVGW